MGEEKKKQYHSLMRQDQAHFLGVGIPVKPSMPVSAPLLQYTKVESSTILEATKSEPELDLATRYLGKENTNRCSF